MTLPIDPARIDPDDIGAKQTTLEMDHEDAIEHVREVFTEAGFGIPVEFSPSELLNEKVDADRDPTTSSARVIRRSPTKRSRRPTGSSVRSSRVTSSSGRKNPVDSASTTSRSCGSRDSSEWHRTTTRWRTS